VRLLSTPLIFVIPDGPTLRRRVIDRGEHRLVAHEELRTLRGSQVWCLTRVEIGTTTTEVVEMSRFQVVTGAVRRPHATILTGRSGIGKTYFCSTIPARFFVCVEEGLKGAAPDQIETLPRFELQKVSKKPTLRDFFDAMAEFRRIARGQGINHLVVDSLSGIEKLVNKQACNAESVAHMEAKDFKKVWSAATPIWQDVQDEFDLVRDLGINVWIVAHDAEAKETVDDGTIYTKHDLAFQGSGSSLTELRQFWRRWADHVLFIDWDSSVKAGKTMQSKAVGQYKPVRIMYTRESPSRYAKNRAGLPEKLPATWQDLQRAMNLGVPAGEAKLRTQIEQAIAELHEDDAAAIRRDLDAAKNPQALAAVLSRAEGMLAIGQGEDGAEATPGADGGPDPFDVPPPAVQKSPARLKGEAELTALWLEAQKGAAELNAIERLTEDADRIGLDTLTDPAGASDDALRGALKAMRDIATRIRKALAGKSGEAA